MFYTQAEFFTDNCMDIMRSNKLKHNKYVIQKGLYSLSNCDAIFFLFSKYAVQQLTAVTESMLLIQ